MSDDLNPKRPDNITPDAQEKKQKPQPVHPLMRRPTPPAEAVEGAPRKIRRVTYAFARPTRTMVTWALIGINVAIFALMMLVPSIQDPVFQNFADQPLAVLQNAQYWRLFTSMFLHANLVHILMNMLALQALGGIMELTFGHSRYILIYLLGGLAGSLLSVALHEPLVWSVGASGAVFALFGAEAAHLYTNWKVLGPAAQVRLRQVVMLASLNLLIGFIGNVDGGGLVNIDNWAHLGGFAGGALLAYLIGPIYVITSNADDSAVVIRDLRPLNGQIATVVYFGAGLLGLLLVAVLVR